MSSEKTMHIGFEGIELEPEYVESAKRRIEHAARYTYQLVDHPKSGEVYALHLWGEVTIIGLCGPLDQDDRAYAKEHGLDSLEYDVVDLEWAEGVEWRPHYEASA